MADQDRGGDTGARRPEVDRPGVAQRADGQVAQGRMTCGADPVRMQEASSPKVTSRTSCSLFSMVQWPRRESGEPGGAGLRVGQAGDRIHDRGPPSAGVQVAALARDLEDLDGVGEAAEAGADTDGLEGADLHAAVALVAGAVGHVISAG